MSNVRKCDFCGSSFENSVSFSFPEGQIGKVIVSFQQLDGYGILDEHSFDICPECQQKLYARLNMNKGT